MDPLDEAWAERFGLPAGSTDTGYGHDQAQVQAIQPEPDALLEYHASVAARTTAYLHADQLLDRGRHGRQSSRLTG